MYGFTLIKIKVCIIWLRGDQKAKTYAYCVHPTQFMLVL